MQTPASGPALPATHQSPAGGERLSVIHIAFTLTLATNHKLATGCIKEA